MLNEPFYNVREASKLTRLSYWTIWDLLKRGKIARVKVGSKTFIRESELKKLFVDVPTRPYVRKAKESELQRLIVDDPKQERAR